MYDHAFPLTETTLSNRRCFNRPTAQRPSPPPPNRLVRPMPRGPAENRKRQAADAKLSGPLWISPGKKGPWHPMFVG